MGRTVAENGKGLLRGLSFFGFLIALVAFLGGVAFAAHDWNAEINKTRATKWDKSQKESRRIAGEKLFEIGRNAEVPRRDRINALHNSASVLLEGGAGHKDAALLRKALEVDGYYLANFRGSEYNDNKFLSNQVRANIALLKLGQKEQREAAMKSVDELEKMWKGARPNFGWNPDGCHGLRAQVYLALGETDKAFESYDTYFERVENASAAAYADAANAYLAAGKADRALEIAIAGMAASAGSRDMRLVEQALEACLRTAKLDDARTVELLPKLVRSDKALEAVLMAASRRKYLAGDVAGALAYAKSAFCIAPINDMKLSTDWLCRCLRAKHMSVAKANELLAFIGVGTAGADGRVGTADDLANPLGDVPGIVNDEMRAALTEQLAAMQPTADRIYETLRDRGTVYLLMGDYENALGEYRRAYVAASIKQVREASALVPRVLKAMDCSLVRANRYLEYQGVGQAGKDGKLGTGDDLEDPLAGLDIERPTGADQALQALAQTPGNTQGDAETRAYAYLALGETQKALGQMQMAFALASMDDESLARAAEGIAAVIKAVDGHVKRANAYLLYQYHGAAGKDGKLGTGDDLTDPMQEVMGELAAADKG